APHASRARCASCGAAYSFLLAQGLLYKLNSDWQAALQNEIDKAEASSHPETSDRKAQDELAGMKVAQMLPLQVVCSDPKMSDLWTGCDDVQAIRFIGSGAVCAALLRITLVLIIGAAGRLSRSSRTLLLAFFRPGLYLTIIVLVGLILLHAVLAMGS